LKIRLGMVGGGPGAFIGGVHRMASALDGHFDLVAGAFSSDPGKSASMGAELGLAPARAYSSFKEMAAGEAALPLDERIEAVSIVTPNHLHHAAAMAFLRTDVHVICDKPLTTTLADAEELCREAAQRDLVFCVTHNYSGYPMVKEAAERVSSGELGVVRKVVVEYSQGWLATLLEAEGHKQASWRADPERAGASSALGDIGTHAHHLAGYVTGMEPSELFADLGTLVSGRAMEDDATILMRYEGGARGLLTASQVATGERNHLRLRVYGSDGGLDWSQERPDRLRLLALDGAERILYDGGPGLSDRGAAFQRLPAGHPEGFIEAFANVYTAVARTLGARSGRVARGAYDDDFPSVQDGARGVFFVEAALRSAASGAWESATYSPPA
jgi:predicted dehydrogenase